MHILSVSVDEVMDSCKLDLFFTIILRKKITK